MKELRVEVSDEAFTTLEHLAQALGASVEIGRASCRERV